ncbi:MAG: polysaccharide biosynthesis/export family protein [Bacteroidales bacterium]|jgi:polysaccharide export outer membrane protein
MKKYKIVNFFILLVLFSLLSSCASREKIVYFSNPPQDTAISRQTIYNPVFKKDDFISVIVTCDDPEAAKPFNFPEQFMDKNYSNSGYTTGVPAKAGYLIDQDGYVNLPVIGKVHLAGMKRTEAIDMLEQKYSQYLQHPIVNIHIENFKISVLGEVYKPGTFKIPNERITILEAIGLAGDLKISGERKNVLVIRDNDGVKAEYRVDLTSQDILYSPVYYLEQNDVVYVEPNQSARRQATVWRTEGVLFISLISLIITTLSIIF